MSTVYINLVGEPAQILPTDTCLEDKKKSAKTSNTVGVVGVDKGKCYFGS